METAAVASPPVSLWKDWRFYAKWWGFWATVLFLSSGVTRIPTGGPVSTLEVIIGALVYAVGGAVFGLVLASVFTLLQNTLNRGRRKAVSWLLAIGVYLVITTPWLIAVVT